MRMILLKDQIKYVHELAQTNSKKDWLKNPNSISTFTKMIFHNKYSFHLTRFGFDNLKKYKKFIRINYDTGEIPYIKSKHLLILNFGMKSPFYFDKKYLYTLDEDEATILLLANGDLDLYYEMKKDEKSV